MCSRKVPSLPLCAEDIIACVIISWLMSADSLSMRHSFRCCQMSMFLLSVCFLFILKCYMKSGSWFLLSPFSLPQQNSPVAVHISRNDDYDCAVTTSGCTLCKWCHSPCSLHSKRHGKIGAHRRQYFCQDHGVCSVPVVLGIAFPASHWQCCAPLFVVQFPRPPPPVQWCCTLRILNSEGWV